MNKKTQERLEKKLNLIKILSKNTQVTLEELEVFTGRSKKELFKDLGELFMVGSYPYTPVDYIDIDYDGQKVTLHLPASLDETIGLSIQEWLAVRQLVESILQQKQGTQEEPILREIFFKIQEIISNSKFVEYEQIKTEITKAMNQKKQIHFNYKSREQDIFEHREVDPWLIFLEQTYYLIGYCHTKKGIRNFRLDNIQNLVLTETPIQCSPEKEDEEQAVRQFREFIKKTSDLSMEAEILVSSSSYFNLSRILNLQTIEERYIYHGKEFRKERAKIMHEDWFLDTIKSFGNSVILISPLELKQRIQKDLEVELKKFGEN